MVWFFKIIIIINKLAPISLLYNAMFNIGFSL